MKLLHLHEWSGQSARDFPRDDRFPPRERYIGMVTRLPLREALEKLSEYQCRFQRRFVTTGRVVEFRLLSVSDIEDLPNAVLNAYDLAVIEELKVDD